jgi:hypothetical protein
MPPTGVFEQIALQGGSVERATSGDAGCQDPRQAPYAIHLRVRVPAGARAESDVYLFTYADRAAWGREAAAFEACRSAYEATAAPAGSAVPHIDISPYRAFGSGWSPEVENALIRALTKAAGSGG